MCGLLATTRSHDRPGDCSGQGASACNGQTSERGPVRPVCKEAPDHSFQTESAASICHQLHEFAAALWGSECVAVSAASAEDTIEELEKLRDELGQTRAQFDQTSKHSSELEQVQTELKGKLVAARNDLDLAKMLHPSQEEQLREASTQLQAIKSE